MVKLEKAEIVRNGLEALHNDFSSEIYNEVLDRLAVNWWGVFFLYTGIGQNGRYSKADIDDILEIKSSFEYISRIKKALKESSHLSYFLDRMEEPFISVNDDVLNLGYRYMMQHFNIYDFDELPVKSARLFFYVTGFGQKKALSLKEVEEKGIKNPIAKLETLRSSLKKNPEWQILVDKLPKIDKAERMEAKADLAPALNYYLESLTQKENLILSYFFNIGVAGVFPVKRIHSKLPSVSEEEISHLIKKTYKFMNESRGFSKTKPKKDESNNTLNYIRSAIIARYGLSCYMKVIIMEKSEQEMLIAALSLDKKGFIPLSKAELAKHFKETGEDYQRRLRRFVAKYASDEDLLKLIEDFSFVNFLSPRTLVKDQKKKVGSKENLHTKRQQLVEIFDLMVQAKESLVKDTPKKESLSK